MAKIYDQRWRLDVLDLPLVDVVNKHGMMEMGNCPVV